MNHFYSDFLSPILYLGAWEGPWTVKLNLNGILTIAFSFLVSFSINTGFAQKNQTCPANRPDYFCISPDMAPQSKIDIVQFYSIPAQILGLFQIELSLQPYPLFLNADWESPYFGAGVSLYENQFRLMILGGTSRIDDLTPDAYAAIVCHELGHIIAGAPYQTIPFAEWSSAEGQADFFAASQCLPKYFKFLSEIPESSQTQNPMLNKTQSLTPVQTFARVEDAGFQMLTSFHKTFKDGDAPVRFKPDLTKTPVTLINNYPSAQCRYENFRNPSQRPRCWFR